MPKKTKEIKFTDRKKAWLKKVKPSAYQIETKEVKKTILVVGEGQTEKLYFESFPVLTLTVEVIDLKGQSKLQLIEATETIIQYNDRDYDIVWCVFDMDVKSGRKEFADFDNAIKSGHSKGYKIAYSNDCFELWFYLHYTFTQQKNHRQYYYKVLSEKWGCNYEKEGKAYNFCKAIYSRLIDDSEASQDRAIESAKKLYKRQSDLVYHDQNPVTKVYELVAYLNHNIRR